MSQFGVSNLVPKRIFDLVRPGPTLHKYRPELQSLLALGQIEPAST